MSGRVGDLSIKQEELLKEFKILLADVLEPKHDDHLLLQFLRARCFDLKKSEDMFRKHLLWRKKFPEEYLLNEYKCSEVLKNYYIGPFLGFDREGCPVRLVRPGCMDLNGVHESHRLHELFEYIVYCFDSDMKLTKEYNGKLGRHVETRTGILDLGDLSLRQVTKRVLEILMAYFQLYEANFPENLKVVYVVNVPYFFSFLFNIAKSCLSANTIDKIKVFGRDGYKEELVALMDPEILPVSLGGTRVDENGDGACQSLFGTPGKVPSYFYLRNQRRVSDAKDVQQLTVDRMSKREIDIYADTPGSTISWKIEVPHQDLFYGIFYKKEGGNDVYVEEIVPFQKVGGIHGTGCGNYVIKKLGKYVLIFDNEYSYIRSKRVHYKFKLKEPFAAENSTEITI